ncbi:MAG: ORF6N domain-containing protein [Gallionella sp.]|nr:ORF6N domain-containing protein [Gallionella sp.]
MTEKQATAATAGIVPRTFFIRGQKVMLGEDLAALYEVEIDALNLAVTRNIECFPEGCMFQLNPDEFADLKSRFAISIREAPYVFTGHGLALLSSVLLDERASHDNRESCAPTCSCRK